MKRRVNKAVRGGNNVNKNRDNKGGKANGKWEHVEPEIRKKGHQE
jgi:hypothetical protein